MTRNLARSGSVELSYSVEGSGPETVLLLMGLGGRAADWGSIFPAALTTRYRVVRFDNRGVGGSPPTAGGYTLPDMAADAVAVLDAVGAERAHVVGYSMGGMISQLIATHHAARVDRLVLLSTHFGGRELEPPTASAQRLFDPQEYLARGRDARTLMRFTMELLTPKGFVDRAPEALAMMVENIRAEPTKPMAFMAQVQAILGSNRSELVRDIRKPTLVIHGTEDELIPVANGRELAARVPGARLELLQGVGHMPMLECPEELGRIVLDFLSRG